MKRRALYVALPITLKELLANENHRHTHITWHVQESISLRMDKIKTYSYLISLWFVPEYIFRKKKLDFTKEKIPPSKAQCRPPGTLCKISRRIDLDTTFVGQQILRHLSLYPVVRSEITIAAHYLKNSLQTTVISGSR